MDSGISSVYIRVRDDMRKESGLGSLSSVVRIILTDEKKTFVLAYG